MEHAAAKCSNCGCDADFVGNGLQCKTCKMRFGQNADGSVTIVGNELKRIENIPLISHYQIMVDGDMIMAHAELTVGDKRLQGSALEMPTVECAVACAIWKAFAQLVPDTPEFYSARYYLWLGGGGETRIRIGSNVFVRHCGHGNSIVAVVEAMLGILPDFMNNIMEGTCYAV